MSRLALLRASEEDVAQLLAERRSNGQDLLDYYDDGVYVLVNAPGIDHALIVTELTRLLAPHATRKGLALTGIVNIGEERDFRIPDMALFRPDTMRTSPAFLSTAELVVEVLSPGDEPRAKLPFYGLRAVKEYLEVDPLRRTVALWRNGGSGWSEAGRIEALDLSVHDLAARVAWPGLR